jgi:hypothetical protein
MNSIETFFRDKDSKPERKNMLSLDLRRKKISLHRNEKCFETLIKQQAM